MGINNFVIIFDNNPNKTFSPGDTISGKVILDLNSVKKINAIRIKYKGRTKTQWTRRHGKSTTHYSGKEIYFENTSFIVQGNNAPFELPSGTHTYEFSFTLPSSLPSSFSTKQGTGTVKYAVKVTMDRPWKFDQSVKNEFFVIQPLDLNEINFVKVPATLIIERHFCCCFKVGNINIKVSIPCSGFTCGQNVPFVVEIENISNLRIDGFKIDLKKYYNYFTTNKNSKKTTSELLLSNNIPLRVSAYSSETCFHNVTIPTTPIYNLNMCSIIDIDYKLKFKFKLSGLHSNIPGQLPVLLGDIPLNYITPIEEMNTPPAALLL